MKKYIVIGALSLSIILNVILICYICFSPNSGEKNPHNKEDKFANVEQRNQAARSFIKQIVCQDLYYPSSYDPVSIQVDSAFYGPLTDPDCVKAATELIDLRKELSSAQSNLKQAIHDIKIFGSSGVFWHHAENKKNAEAKINELTPKIQKREEIIKNRDTSKDHQFIGWVISHRYRASNHKGNVLFSDVVYVVDPEMQNWLLRYMVDEKDSKNIKAIDEVIRKELGTYSEE